MASYLPSKDFRAGKPVANRVGSEACGVGWECQWRGLLLITFFPQLEIKSHVFFSPINWDDLYHKRLTPPFNPNVVRGHHVLASGFPGLVEAWRLPGEDILAWALPIDGRTESPRSSVICSSLPCKPEAELGPEPESPDCQFSSVWGARLPPFTFNTNNPHHKALSSF